MDPPARSSVRHRQYHDEISKDEHDVIGDVNTETMSRDPEGRQIEMQRLTADEDGDGHFAPSSKVPQSDDSLEDEFHVEDWKERLEDFLFPPHLPRSCQLLRPENIAVPMCYLLVGLLQGLSSPLVNVFPLDLGATPAQQTSISAIRSLPASFKLLFGFMSDNLPVMGYRRKPYMFFGWFMASLSLFLLLANSNLNIQSRGAGCFQSDTDVVDVNDDSDRIPDDAPSIGFFSICLFGFGTGFWVADVMGDSIVAEKAKLEPEASRGSIQSSCYSYRFFGMMVAAPLSTVLYSYVGPYYVILLLSLLPMCILPLVYMLYEDTETPPPSIHTQCQEIWNTVCSRAAWQPMAFVYIYNVLQVGNASWREFLVSTLHFTTCQLNMILIVALVLLYLGIICYKYFFITWSWRKVYIVTTIMNGFFSLLQILLIKGVTFGLSNFFFALGDDAFSEFISGIQFLPTTIMMVHLCPSGSEGASYAMFTTVNNSALTLSSALSTVLLNIWDVSKKALQEGRLQGMVNLTYLTTALQVGAIAFVGFLPHYKEDLVSLGSDSQKSVVGGTIFLLITFMSILYAIYVSICNIWFSG